MIGFQVAAGNLNINSRSWTKHWSRSSWDCMYWSRPEAKSWPWTISWVWKEH
jgi:hypothetical protein